MLDPTFTFTILLFALLVNVHSGSICRMLFTPSVPALIVNDANTSSKTAAEQEAATAEFDKISTGLETAGLGAVALPEAPKETPA